MKIRRFKDEDAIKVLEIIKDCFENLDIGKHTQKGIQLQLECNSPEKLIKKSKEIKYFVVEIDKKVIGIGGYDSQKIHTLFISPKYQKKGYGRLVLERILFEAKNKGIKSLFTWSTVFATNFYKSFGFKIVKEIDLPKGRKDITLIEMKKDLY